jgi:hypothetical protein
MTIDRLIGVSNRQWRCVDPATPATGKISLTPGESAC